MEETAALVIKLQNGDETAFDELFAAYQLKAVRTAAFITGDVSLAEDVTQECFVKCLLNIKALKTPERFKPWFFRTLTRCAWKAMDKKNRLIPEEEIFETAESTLPLVFDSYPMEDHQAYAALYKAIGALGKKQRTTIILYYFNDLSIKEIAHITSSLEPTVKSRLHSAKLQLRNSLKEWTMNEGELLYEK